MPAPPVDLHKAAHRAERLFEVNRKLNTMRDPDALLQFIIETAAEVLQCAATSVLLVDEATGKLRFAAATGADPDELAQIPVPLDDSIAGTIFTENRPIRVDNTADDARHFDAVGEKVAMETRTLVGVPMQLGDTPIGVLEGINKANGVFTEDDVAVLSVIASQAAVAIRNARQLQALEDAHAKLSELDALKSDFLAIASHELRTPLSAILGYGAIVKEEAGEAVAPHVDAILDAADGMEDIVEAMSQMEILRSDRVDLARQQLTLIDVLRQACAAVDEAASARNQSVTIEGVDPGLTLSADPERLRAALEHVLDNACRFTPEGGAVTLRAEAPDDRVRIAVTDTGIGVPADELDRIFDDFYQVEDTLTRSQGGLGLGLTLARKLVQLHDGRIWAESDGINAGTTVIIELPQSPDASRPADGPLSPSAV